MAGKKMNKCEDTAWRISKMTFIGNKKHHDTGHGWVVCDNVKNLACI